MTAFFIALGAVVGALSRYYLGLVLNPVSSALSLGVLTANWLGCLLIGVCLALSLTEQSRLLFITGFLGSFTTFSAFSAEVVDRLLSGRYAQGLFIVLLHTLGGVVCTLVGFILVKGIKS